MKFTLQDGSLRMAAGGILLAGWRPRANGRALAATWRPTARGFAAETEPGTFELETRRESGQPLRARWHFRPAAAAAVASFGCEMAVSGHRAFLRQGYFSWDGSSFICPGEAAGREPVRGYAMTQLLAATAARGLVLGFERHDRFQHTFTFAEAGARLEVDICWDEKPPAADGTLTSEWLAIFASGAEVEEGLREWARLVAAAASPPPRLHVPRITGWCSWYNLYAAITEENIREHLRSASAAGLGEEHALRVFQIDDGFTPEMGDWLETKPQFPRGMKPLLDEIRAAGFRPGLWIAPFMVGNRSGLYARHPDWVVRDRETGGPLVQMRFYGEFRWHKRSEEYYILDPTHPDALAWLREVFRVWRAEWGCEYFKTDFMHFASAHGPDRAVHHQPGLTRIEVWRQAAETIRSALGDAIWLGCGCPLWASAGLVDGVRIGRDIGVEWKGDYSAESLLRDQATRNFAHGILWQADPDCVLLRDRFHHLTDAQVRSLALYAGLAGGVAMTSDKLDELSEARRELWRFILSAGAGGCRFPGLARPACSGRGFDPMIVQVGGDERAGFAVLLFNPSDQEQERSYPLESLGLPARCWMRTWPPGAENERQIDVLHLTVPARDSVLTLLRPC